MASFLERFASARLDAEPLGLQLVYFGQPEFEADAIAHFLHVHPEMSEATCELASASDLPGTEGVVSASGPPASCLGLIGWGPHVIKLLHCDAAMPYGPIESCVLPALMPSEIKSDARLHKSHSLIYYAGTHPDPMERYVALAAAAGALARFDAIAVLNEEARTAAPALDLIPDEGEDILATLRGLPIPYLWGGFVKMDTGDPQRPWVRTFACHRLGLPNLARQLAGHHEGAETFQLFSAVLGYAREMQEPFAAGESLDMDGVRRFILRVPSEREWFLKSPGRLFVLESESSP